MNRDRNVRVVLESNVGALNINVLLYCSISKIDFVFVTLNYIILLSLHRMFHVAAATKVQGFLQIVQKVVL